MIKKMENFSKLFVLLSIFFVLVCIGIQLSDESQILARITTRRPQRPNHNRTGPLIISKQRNQSKIKKIHHVEVKMTTTLTPKWGIRANKWKSSTTPKWKAPKTPKWKTLNIPKRTASTIPKNTTSTIPKRITSKIPKRITSKIPKRITSTIRKNTTSKIPKGITSTTPKITTSTTPKRTISTTTKRPTSTISSTTPKWNTSTIANRRNLTAMRTMVKTSAVKSSSRHLILPVLPTCPQVRCPNANYECDKATHTCREIQHV